jgi:hypothetical protein
MVMPYGFRLIHLFADEFNVQCYLIAGPGKGVQNKPTAMAIGALGPAYYRSKVKQWERDLVNGRRKER